jgi:hypothetical protein
MRARLGSCALLAGLLIVSCKSGTQASPGGGAGKSETSHTGQADVESKIKKHIADKMSVPADTVEVTILEDADVPGIVVFSTYVAPPKKGRPGRHAYGVVAGDTVESDHDRARTLVLDAWNYIPERTVPAEKVARVLGLLEGKSREPAEPILLQKHIDAMSEHQKKVLFLPREATVDGTPAVQYWMTSGDVPLWLSTAVIGPDRKVTIKKEEHWE